MLSRVRASVRRSPAAARLIAIAALLLVAASAHLAVRADPAGRWVTLLVVGVVGAVVAGSPSRLWPLPAIWLVATALAVTTAGGADGGRVLVAAVAGAVAFAVCLAVDLVTVLRGRRGRVRT
ncbi:hypothetical protein [Curtobacterium sp. PhB115]|uniref:hypothetical protein n=1 Tax=Curtobacterium sp. PhB115 TaxID=2485173 RepID=UPI000FA6975F|nr:hypothetical protein [Curtobacterium sp. PhB115]ROP72298.1 hypothetical protein EDF19_1313 [Curtobacterium sp. PhB115]